jgi:voltage-gated potassium channel
MTRGGKALTLMLTLGVLIASGTVFFHYVEGWSWIDSYFFTVVTLSTVGYGSLVPATALGKVATTIFIFLGLGVFVVAVQQVGAYIVAKREAHTEWLIGHLGHHHASREDKPDTVNEPKEPGA